MRTEQLMEMARDRFENKNHITDYDLKMPLLDFILKIYSTCDPACYGANWSKYIIGRIGRDEKVKNTPLHYNVNYIKHNANKGDMGMMYPPIQWPYGGCYFTDPEDNKFYDIKYEFTERMYIENKISFLGRKSGLYTLRNLRPYQDLDGYLFTFVDCDDDFKFKFLMISHQDLYRTGYLTFTPMNSTKKDNKENKKIVYGTTIKKGSYEEDYLLHHNKLNGTGIDDLVDYMIMENDKLKSNFIKKFHNKKNEDKPKTIYNTDTEENKKPVSTFWLTQNI